MSGWRTIEDFALAVCCDAGKLAAHVEKPWRSATFEGARHELTVIFRGDDDVLIGEAVLDQWPRHQFALAGQLVVESRVGWVNRQNLPEPMLTMQLELLLVRDTMETAA